VGIWVKRFGLTERFAHWWTVLMVAAALLTGIAMGDEVESGPLLTVHVGARSPIETVRTACSTRPRRPSPGH